MIRRARLLPALLILAWFALPATAGAVEVLIRASQVHTMTGPPLEPGAVLIADGKIVEVAEEIEAPEGAKVIDLGDGVLIPGLIDAASDIGIDGPSVEFTKEVTPEYCPSTSIDWSARAFLEALAEGTTCVNLVPGSENVVAGLACAIKTAGSDKAKRSLTNDQPLVVTVASDPTSRNRSRARPDSIYVRQPTNRMGVIWILRTTFQGAMDAPTESTATPLDPFNAGDLTPVREALAGDRPMLALSRTDYDILALLRLAEEYGFAPILFGGQEAYKVKDRLASRQIPVILEPLTTTRLLGRERTDLAWNVAGLLHEAGVPVALSGGDLLDQARFAARFGLPREEALRAITATPADLIGLGDRLGSIEPGKDADFVAFNGDPLAFTTAIEWVMVDGSILHSNTMGNENEGN